MESKRNNRAIHVDNHKNKVIDVENLKFIPSTLTFKFTCW